MPAANCWPRISLVTPSLNAEKTIERTLRSIQAQEYPNLQLICIDGGSQDATLEILQRHRHLISDLASEKDKNVADALNKGFRIADGDIFGYLNADDALAPGALRRVAEVFLAEPGADVVTGGCRRIFADGSEAVTQVPERFVRTMSLRNDIEQPSTFWRATIHRKVGEFDDSFQLAFDWEWWNRLRVSGARFGRIPDVLSLYYFSDANLTSRAGQRVIDEMYRVTKKYGPYRGRVADLYMALYKVFDLRGFYDKPFREQSRLRQLLFGGTLMVLCTILGREVVKSYNWNWASKQVRGLVWYK
ncbi:MAG TPA: glycosyltransferase family 2 protein [Terriglobales bacterium]|nr:glycosyltransferase family 2 protein [Terriglobales bacterium]